MEKIEKLFAIWNMAQSLVSVLIDVWTKAFGAADGITRRSVKIRLDKLVREHYNHVYSVLHRKNTKHDVSGKSKPARQLNKERKKKIEMKPGVLNGDILDIGKGMEGLKGDELEFYIDQKTTRKGRISEEINIEYEEEREAAVIEEARQQEIERAEMDYYMQLEDVEETDSTIGSTSSLNQSLNRSGLVQMSVPTNNVSIQTEDVSKSLQCAICQQKNHV